MKRSSILRPLVGLTLTAVIACLAPQETLAQGDPGVRESYFRALGEHFEVPYQEVKIIGDWDLAPDEVPVVLFLARRAGVSSDALIGLRRTGRSWREVSTRFGLSPRTFHLNLPEGAPLGPLARVFQEFRSRPTDQWGQIELQDSELVALVNIRVLSEAVGVPPLRVLEAWSEAGSFMAAYPILRGR